MATRHFFVVKLLQIGLSYTIFFFDDIIVLWAYADMLNRQEFFIQESTFAVFGYFKDFGLIMHVVFSRLFACFRFPYSGLLRKKWYHVVGLDPALPVTMEKGLRDPYPNPSPE